MSWMSALAHTLLEFEGTTPECGKRDCCQFASAYVAKRTGVDYASHFKYHDEHGAARLIVGSGGIEALVASCIGKPTSEPPCAGDLVSLDIGTGKSVIVIGVYVGYCTVFYDHEAGLARSTRAAQKVWALSDV